MKKPRKKLSPANIAIDAIIAGVVIIIAIVIITSVTGKKDNRLEPVTLEDVKKDTSSETGDNSEDIADSSEDNIDASGKDADNSGDGTDGLGDSADDAKGSAAPESTAAPENDPTAAPDSKETSKDIISYSCLVTEGNEKTKPVSFCLEFNEKEKTYQHYMKSGDDRQMIEQGTYTEKKGKISTSGGQNGTPLTFLKDGKYLVIETSLLEGTVPKGKHFKAEFVSDTEDIGKISIYFYKDGSYVQELSRYDIGNDEAVEKTKGTYKRKGNLIERKLDSGVKLIPLYIYKNQVSSGYYELD